ncbi:MAG: sensor histidine kinase [Candidatus Binatia bacterium]
MARKTLPNDTGHTILVVDDQEETLLSVRSLLEREGHRVLTAESGHQALRIFKEHEIHLLLVDYFMPRMTGEQLIREIRKFDPFVQIILQTGYSGQKPPRLMLAELDIQGYHDKADGPERLLLWVDVGLKAFRMIRRLLERERLQRELVANVSHEFRTPLNVIAGYTELLVDNAYGSLPKSALQIVGRVQQATWNLGELVEDFLKYAKIEAGGANVVPSEVAIVDLVEEMKRLAGQLADSKDIRFSTECWAAPESIVSDSVKLRTVLRNLVSNAMKFTEKGSVSVRIALHDDDVCFAVTDTGPGIRQEDLEVIFEPFRQLDGSTTRHHGGIGLGLALSRKLAILIGGDIAVHSELGVGSTFMLRVPSAKAAARLREPRRASPDAEKVVLPAAAELC